ncbi:unnamed protein product [Phytophthora lilii]|uniref:Unnamed protein product n=1 Tax=Phytophthora lilii TaxID=2077276 RepID=A0A9W6U6E3_9STRA|nr:unnamed protein product [Phytophthora lilii]
MLSLQLPTRPGLMLQLGSATADAARNEVFVGSSQNTSVVAELPCVSDVTDAFHDVEFVWDDSWLRWYVDQVLLLEEFILDAEEESSASEGDSNVVLELSVKNADGSAKLAVERIALDAGNASDPYCTPRYSSSSNCRAQECTEAIALGRCMDGGALLTDAISCCAAFSPRLGSIRGSLSVDEVESFIDEVNAAFPLITKVEELGRSVEDRPLRALCLGACNASEEQNVPQALFTGMHHAREPISMMVHYRNGDLAALELLTSRQLWFILVVNPDGYAHNEMMRVWEHNKIGQRKSGARTCDTSPPDAGVDLNRNYDVCFARDSKGSSTDQCGDDYNGPNAFSEPEAQAVRELVERNSSHFSVALNYHSYGKYFNLPFACQAEGEPTEPNNSVFVALAREMAHFNRFEYGQSWKESNLYTVNGETSDWMWQAHGIFAMSPEVGPAFNVSSVPGFWPPREDVPGLSTELHYSNLYLARLAGPAYSLIVTGVQLGAIDDGGTTVHHISVEVTVSNNGLRPASAELLGSVFMNGSSTSDIVHLDLKAEPEGSGLESASKSHTLMIPYSVADFHQSMNEIDALYLLVRDSFSCHLFRVAVHFHTSAEKTNLPNFQTWSALPLPRCGTCENFGASPNADESASKQDTSPICSEIQDVSNLEFVRTRNVVPPMTETKVDSASSSRFGPTTAPTPVISTSSGPAPSTATNDASSNVNSSASAPSEASNDQRASISSSILPSSVTWSGPVVMASLACIALLAVVVLFFRRRRRRSKNKPARAKSASGTQKRRSNVQYSRIDEDAASSPATRVKQPNYDEEDEEIDLLDAECGETGLSPDDDAVVVMKDRATSPRRASKALRSPTEDVV